MSMLNVHTVSNGALMITSCLERNGGFMLFPQRIVPTWLRFLQGCVKPIWSQMGDGCHPDRETWKELEKAGFGRLEYERITAPTLIVSPQIVGVAVKTTTN